MKTPLRLFITLLLFTGLVALEVYLHAEAPYKKLYGGELPSWAPPVEGFIGLVMLIPALSALIFFRALAGFRFPVNRQVLTFSALMPLLATGLNYTTLHFPLLAGSGVLFVMALAAAWLTSRAFKMDWLSGVLALPLTVLFLAGMVLFWELAG